jgi:hypothetical protein
VVKALERERTLGETGLNVRTILKLVLSLKFKETISEDLHKISSSGFC